MGRVVFFIDGFNVYHSLSKKYRRYLWLDYWKFASCYITSKDSLEQVIYFTALAKWLPGPYSRHKIFISALKSVGVKVVLGKFKEKERYCPVCKANHLGHEEKQTDVNISLYLYHLAHLDSYDHAVLVTGDTDIVPAVKMVKQSFPHKKVSVLFPIGRRSTELKNVADNAMRTTEKQLGTSQFPDPVILPDGKILNKPSNWI